MSWIVSDWRLKLLALGLSLGLLGAVSFSENPFTLTSVNVRINYAGSNLPADLVLVNPPTRVSVPVLGVRDAVSGLAAGSIVVTPDLAHLKLGTVTVSAAPRVLAQGVSLQVSTVAIQLTVSRLETQVLPIDVRTSNLAPGVTLDTKNTYAVCGDTLVACEVRVSAPESLFSGLAAYVNYSAALGPNATVDSNNFPVHFEQSGRPIDFATLDTYPLPTVDHAVVSVHIHTLGGIQSQPVPLRVTTTGSLACGYELTSITIRPTSVVQVTGPSSQVATLTSIALTPIDITNLSAGTTVTRSVTLSDSSLKADPSTVRVSVAVQQVFSCAAPTPAPSPSASP